MACSESARCDPVLVPLAMEQGSPVKELLYHGNGHVSQKDQDPPSIWANTVHLPDRSYSVDSAVFFKTWSRARGKRWRPSRRSRLKKISTCVLKYFLVHTVLWSIDCFLAGVKWIQCTLHTTCILIRCRCQVDKVHIAHYLHLRSWNWDQWKPTTFEQPKR